MHVFKPLQTSLLYKTFEWEGRQRFAVSLLLGFTFDSDEAMLEQDLWAFIPSETGGGILDLCMPKPNGEVLVYGSCFAPGGAPVTESGVRLRLGPVDKKLLVYGDRYWRAMIGPSEPEPFRVMPLDYAHAFGGPGFEKNPIGKGMVEVDAYGEMRRPLPNIEDPRRVMTSSSERPEPAGFGPLDVAWETRASRLGTYDQKWIEERAPDYPLDLDWNHFNAAPDDQWVDEFFRGDEEFELVNMHPEKRVQKGALPGFRARCFVEKVLDGEEKRFEEVGMRPETVWFFPHLETGIVLYRGVTDISTDDASDIAHLVAAYENLADSARPQEHYVRAMANRVDPERAHLYMLNTTDLIPDGATCGYSAAAGVDITHEEEVAKQQEAEAEAMKAEAVAELETEKTRLQGLLTRLGVDPKPFIARFDNSAEREGRTASDWPEVAPKINAEIEEIAAKQELTPEDLAHIEDLLLSAEDLATEQDKAAKTLLSMLASHLDQYEGADGIKKRIVGVLEEMSAAPGFPRPPASEVEAKLYIHKPGEENLWTIVEEPDRGAEAGLLESGAEALILRLSESAEEMKSGYREQAHLLEKGVPSRQVTAGRVREAMLDLLRNRKSVAGGDFCGVDLSEQDLSGADLRGCYLEGANLSNAKLAGANLEGAILVFSNLSGCDLSGARLGGANLGAANLKDALIDGADTRGVQFAKSNLAGTKLTHCDLSDTDFSETVLEGTDFSGSTFSGAAFSELEMSRARFREATLPGSEFINCTLEGADFSGAELDESSWIECKMDSSDFTAARMSNTRFPGGTSLRYARFARAILETANLRDADLRGADFSEANLTMADFGNAAAEKTVFRGSVAKYAQFIGTDLGGADLSGINMMEGSLLKARLTSANLSDANCYGVEFMKATVGDTKFGRTILDMTKLEKWSPGR